MNLTGDPWVPVVLANGESRLVSLTDAFRRGNEILDLVAAPPQRVALTRLLVCVAQAALDGPADEDEWRLCREQIAPAAVEYLAKWRDRFELLGEGAFLQVPNLVETSNATLDKLDFGLAAGNNAVLFDHGALPDGRPQTAAWTALMLLTYQCFSPGGTIGVSEWNSSTTSRNSEHAPCLEGSMLHTIVRGPSLLDSVHLNLINRDVIEGAARVVWGRPVWERMPEGPNDPSIPEQVASYLGRLVPVSRAIKLRPDSTRLTLVNGCAYPKLPHRELAATVVRRGKDEQLAYLGVDLAKHPWRELGSILATSRSVEVGGAFPLRHLIPGDGHVDLWTGGLAANKGKVLDVAEWSFHLPLSLVGEVALGKYRNGIGLAERASRRLWSAVSTYFEDLAVGEFKRSDLRSRQHQQRVFAKASASYWRALDGRYSVLIEAANEETADLGESWYPLVRAAMDECYQRACPHDTARQIRAFAKGALKLRLRRPAQGNPAHSVSFDDEKGGSDG